MGLLKLAEKHSPTRLEEACKKALLYSRTPSYISIKNLLAATKEDPSLLHKIRIHFHQRPDHKARGITRGARYYRYKRS